MTEPNRAIVLGALSAIGEATARLYAAEGWSLALAGRDAARLATLAADLKLRGAARVETIALDLATEPDIAGAFARMAATIGGADDVLMFYGVLGDQKAAERDPLEAARLIVVNYVSAAQWCLAAANHLEAQGRGNLVVIGSVAGDRGRQSNYVYGSAKAGLAALVQGIAHRLNRTGARAVLVKPGFVATPMTEGMARGGPLWATPERVAILVKKAAQGGGPVVYAPGFWRWIMLAIRNVPATVMHRTKL